MEALFHFLWSIDKNIHCALAREEQSTNLHPSLPRTSIGFHFDEQIDIAVLPIIAPRAAAKQNDTPRMKRLDDAMRDLLNQRLIDDATFRYCFGRLHITET